MFEKKIIVVTGATGTVGSSVVKHLIQYDPGEIRAFDNNESDIFLLGEKYRQTGIVTPYLGDVRDAYKLEQILDGADIVYHLAAYKHVNLAEYNPFDAVQTNILGVQNVIKAALKCRVKRVLFTSSDKAVNPTSVMGTTKLMGERLITAANIIHRTGETILASCRFGNILGSRGSVVPIFVEQIKGGGPVTVTDRRMTRFIMSIKEATELIINVLFQAKGGEVFIPKMPAIQITDLAKALIDLVAPQYGHDPEKIKITYIGAKPGEKMYEELMNQEESSRSMELDDMFVTLPAFRLIYRNVEYIYPDQVQSKVDKPYISASEQSMSIEALKDFLGTSGIFGGKVL